ncbi:MAG TPA: hypothetical protein VFR10_04300 [bacterium]|nr:hypothetical protein [bacterium]
MPISYRIDHEAHVVVAAGHGVLTDADVFGYQQGVWHRDDVAGYDELVDMTRVTQIALPSIDRVQDLARLSVRMDDKYSRSRFAIVAPTDIAFGLGRMFQSLRELDRESTKQVGVFRTMQEALNFLQLDHPLELPEIPA